MALIEWREDLSVNVAEIDLEHKKLIGMINELNDAMRERKANEVLGKIIEGLLDYTMTHFAKEENYFEQFNYSNAFAHKKEHAAFIEKVKDVKKGFEEGRILLSLDIMNFLKDWLKNHIQGTDKKYTAHFNKNGLK